MRNHFPADLAEAGKPSAERDITVRIHASDIARVVPAVLNCLTGKFGFTEVALHNGRTFDDQEPFRIGGKRFPGDRVDDPGADARHGRSDAALLAGDLAQIEHGIADVDRHDRRELGAAVTFDQSTFTFGRLVETFSDIHPQAFRTGDSQTDFRENFRIAASQIRLNERRRAEQDCHPEIQAGFGHCIAVERTGHINDFAADHQRHPERGIQTESMEDRKRAEDHIAAGPIHDVDKGIDIAVEIVVREHDALGDAGRSAGKEDERGIHHIPVRFRGNQVHEFLMRQQQRQQEHLHLVELGDGFCNILQEYHFRHRFEFDFFQEFAAGDHMGDACLVDGMPDRIPAGSEVQDRGDFVRHEDADAGNRSGAAVRHHDADIPAFRGDHVAEFPAEDCGSDVNLETVERFASVVIHQGPERMELGILGQLIMQRALIAAWSHFRICGKLGYGLAQFKRRSAVRNGVSERDRGGVGDLAREPEFQFPVIIAENTAPHHADPDRDDRNPDIFRQHDAVTG